MVEVGWIKTSLFLMPVLLFAAVTGQSILRVLVRVGDEVTLTCENVIGYQDKCKRTDWLIDDPRQRAAVELIKRGQISERAKSKSDRLSVTQNCSLVIKKVTHEDVGRYTCRQYDSGHGDSRVDLSVVTMTEHENNDQVTLSCSVSEHEWCNHRVEWLYEGKVKDKETSRRICSVNLTYKKQESKKYKSLNCEVTDLSNGQEQQFPFSRQTSGEKPATTTTTATAGRTSTTTERNVTKSPGREIEVWWFIVVAVGLAALLIIAVTLFLCKRTKGKKTRMDENTGQSLNPVVTESGPEITQHTDDGVAYASISYTKKASSKTRVQVRSDDDEDDTVTYSTVRASSSPAAADTADPNNIYAKINKPRK
ncbi:uncharacterized protein LOC104939018 isoform X2 [Larimichthys crocea]|uniref:uncharacterized protein LOC104939018 isoform X2 n=1 Tax=Larimichthys crocea TaxID=215358 RepID=UPI000901440F|nr:uncharacterized protein LOC104939018 isoform X2 [Larimichthys crocea]